MPKPSYNNKVSHTNVYGRIIEQSIFLNQDVGVGSSPTFGSIVVTGDAQVDGNLFVNGNTNVLDTNLVEFQDNIIVVNNLETGSGVSMNQAGMEVDRGTLENYRMIFDEITDTFRVGEISSLQPVATRQDSPLDNGIMIWNDSTSRIESTVTIGKSILFADTTDSTNNSVGSIITSGGIGIGKSIFVKNSLLLQGSTTGVFSRIETGNTSNNLILTSPGDIVLALSGNTTLPYASSLAFGSSNQGVSSSTAGQITVAAGTSILLTTSSTGNVTMTKQAKLKLSQLSNDFYSDFLYNTVITSSNDVFITPTSGGKVVLPEDSSLAFGSVTRQITGAQNGDVSVLAGNHIYITPGPSMDIRIPVNNRIKFGTSGNQVITMNTTNNLNISSSSDIHLSAGNVVLPLQSGLYLGSGQIIRSLTAGTLSVTAGSELLLNVPMTRLQNVVANSNTASTLLVKNSVSNKEILRVDTHTAGSIGIGAKIITSDMIQFKLGVTDTANGYTLERSATRSLLVNIPSYSEYGNSGSVPKFQITSNTTTNLMTIEAGSGNTTFHGTSDTASVTLVGQ